MMNDGAKVDLVGRLGRDPEARYAPSGALCVNFSVAVGRKWTGKDGTEQSNTSWYRVSCWGALAERLVDQVESGALVKGARVAVQGNLEIRDYETKTGERRAGAEVNAREVAVIDRVPPAGAPHPAGSRHAQQAPF